eukprot:1144345-Pelagomonas_calceolata.AAC.4
MQSYVAFLFSKPILRSNFSYFSPCTHQDQDTRSAQECARHAQQLPLARAKIGSPLLNGRVEAAIQACTAAARVPIASTIEGCGEHKQIYTIQCAEVGTPS